MTCIYCNQSVKLSKSHVISKFLRNKLTGIQQGGNKKFDFQWCGAKGLPNQDLPKPYLMCARCDNDFGGTIEGPASEIMMPFRDPSDIQNWLRLPIRVRSMPFNIDGEPFRVAEHVIDEYGDRILRKFSVLTAWRAMHAMRVKGDSDAVDFLNSEDGQKLNQATIQFLKSSDLNADMMFPYYSELYFLGPISAAALSGSYDEVPFAWTFLGDGKRRGIGVLLAYWVIVWRLREDGDNEGSFPELMEMTFADWLLQTGQRLESYTNSR